MLQSAQFAAGLFQAFPADAAFRRFGAIQHAGDNFQLPRRVSIVNRANPELFNQGEFPLPVAVNQHAGGFGAVNQLALNHRRAAVLRKQAVAQADFLHLNKAPEQMLTPFNGVIFIVIGSLFNNIHKLNKK